MTSFSESDNGSISSFSHFHLSLHAKRTAHFCWFKTELLCLPEEETVIQTVKGFLDVCDQQRLVFQETP